eukprot:3465851-Alexandrium_andersonii.AAC.1
MAHRNSFPTCYSDALLVFFGGGGGVGGELRTWILTEPNRSTEQNTTGSEPTEPSTSLWRVGEGRGVQGIGRRPRCHLEQGLGGQDREG